MKGLVFIVHVDVVANRRFQTAGAAKDATAQLLCSQEAKPTLHEVDPGGTVGVKWRWKRGRFR